MLPFSYHLEIVIILQLLDYLNKPYLYSRFYLKQNDIMKQTSTYMKEMESILPILIYPSQKTTD